MKVLFTGGGTGGHIMPIIAIARELKRLYQNPTDQKKDGLKLYYVGPKDKVSFDLFWQENIKTYSIVPGKLRRYFSLLNIVDVLFSIPFGFLQSFFLLLFIGPRLVFSKGGSGSTVVSYAAKFLAKPVFLHESDITPGLSNKTISRWAKKIFASFDKTEFFNQSKMIVVGNPIRKELLLGDIQKAKEMFDLSLEKPIILFSGGSQGAEAINEFVLLNLNQILLHYEIIHISGFKNYPKADIQSKFIVQKDFSRYYHLYGFLNELELTQAYKACNIIIARAGAGSIFEIAALGKPSILIPLPTAAADHQLKNAYQYAKTGAAIVIEQENLTINFFMAEVDSLLSKSEEIKDKALQFAKPDAAEKIAKEILEYLPSQLKS